MANATLRYQEVGAQGLRPFRRRKKKENYSITNYRLPIINDKYKNFLGDKSRLADKVSYE
ncbi:MULTISPECIES: hypothetical protein [Nostocales]|jgi:hypothetical protein|uniref:CpcD n=1 Tax=Aphanizomenon flos-aquae FACHB-1040 TaxID=2692887 RepID=A0ABR8BZU3_APHFL|nr:MULTISPECIES: hypothetical protein [Nostocales]MBD2280152.1 hypothetical protein [Aphanizomenon flos-aquae FACHB-1040]MBO1068877.1 hypothetical protein [Dolichospermum sp. DEX189]MCX5982835.1 hypothetical protein [Nostocales cyanobacterium LacPavin_0920_SED1_MAG_38_18]